MNAKWLPELLSVLKVCSECLSSWFSMFMCVSRDFWGVQQDEGQWWCLYGRHHFDAARCVHVVLGHTLACISHHGGMGSPLSAHWRLCQEDSDLPEDFVKYLWCHMDEYGWSWTETGVLCPSKCLPCSLYVVPQLLCVWTRSSIFLLLFCNACMVSYQSITITITIT